MTATTRSLRSMIVSALWVLLFAAAVVVLWPTRFGGSAVFVIVRGESMEPMYHTGDLLYARASDSFDVGDVAVYETPMPDDSSSLVVHRIIAERDDGTLVFQGDNRDSPDHHHPTRDEVVATPIANFGPIPTQVLLRLPILLAFAVSGTVIWALWPRRDEFDAGEPDDEGDAAGRDEEGDRRHTTNAELARPVASPRHGGAELGERADVQSATSLAERLAAYHSARASFPSDEHASTPAPTHRSTETVPRPDRPGVLQPA